MRTINRDIVGAFIFSQDNKLLMGTSYKGGIYPDALIVPGGGIEPGETMLQAITREVAEEVQLDIASVHVELLDHTFTGQSQKTLRDTGERVEVQMTFHTFRVDMPLLAADIQINTEDDFINARWVDATKLAELNLSPPSMMTAKYLGLL